MHRLTSNSAKKQFLKPVKISHKKSPQRINWALWLIDWSLCMHRLTSNSVGKQFPKSNVISPHKPIHTPVNTTIMLKKNVLADLLNLVPTLSVFLSWTAARRRHCLWLQSSSGWVRECVIYSPTLSQRHHMMLKGALSIQNTCINDDPLPDNIKVDSSLNFTLLTLYGKGVTMIYAIKL